MEAQNNCPTPICPEKCENTRITIDSNNCAECKCRSPLIKREACLDTCANYNCDANERAEEIKGQNGKECITGCVCKSYTTRKIQSRKGVRGWLYHCMLLLSK